MHGKWMYNTGCEEHWNCDEGEFETKEEAIEAGRKYFTESDGYEDNEGDPFDGESFDVGLISYPTISINPWHTIEMAQEQAGEQCGEYAHDWLDRVSEDDEKLLRNMLTNAFNEWVKLSNNVPKFYTIEKQQTIKL